jgi:hypothetical protein
VPETVLTSGVRNVYFDYTIDVPSADTCEVDIYAEGTSGIPVATGILACSQAGANFVTLPAPGGTWADGGYCTVLFIDDIPDSLSGQMPLSWAIGTGTPPACTEPVITPVATPTRITGTPPTATATGTPTSTATPTFTPSPTATAAPATPTATAAPATPAATPAPTNTATPTATPTPTPKPPPTSVVEEPLKHFVLMIDNPLHVNRTGRLHLWVQGTHGKAISGVTVTVDGRKAGVRRILSGHTDRFGNIFFSNVRPTRSAILSVRATKLAYATIQIGLWVQP